MTDLPIAEVVRGVRSIAASSVFREYMVEEDVETLEAAIHTLEAVTVPSESEQSAEIMRILNNAGAYCGECDYEGGYGQDGCTQCAVTLAGYARALLAAGFRLRVQVAPESEDAS